MLAGYGETGNGTSGAVQNTFGTLHYGYNQYDSQESNVNSIYLFDFDNGSRGFNAYGNRGLGVEEAFIAPGDSGGPGLIDVNGQWYVAGVHSFASCFTQGCTVNSSFGEVGGDTSVLGQSAWLRSVTAVPEPGTYAMLLAGLRLVVAVAARRGSRNAAAA